MEPEILEPPEELAIAKSVFRPHSAFHDSGIGTSNPAQTQYTPSHTSFQSSNTEGEHKSLRVPATPLEVHDGIPFECFICKSFLTNIKTRVDWKMHVFSDLQPYICTFTDCEDELVQFSSRAAWANHEFSKHRNTRSWTCPDCSQEIPEVSGWEQHLQEEHSLFFSGTNLQVAKNMALKTEAKSTENDECPLCRIVVGEPRRGFVKHVGQHMEAIALMALPRNVEGDTEEESSVSEHTPLEEDRQSLHSKPLIKENKNKILSDSDVASIRAMHKAEGPDSASLMNKTDDHFSLATSPETTTGIQLGYHNFQLTPAEDECNPIAYDRKGKSNSLRTEELPGDQTAGSDIFCLPHRGEVQFMLATKGAAILGYISVDLFFSQNESLDKIIATQQDKDELIAQNILPYSRQSQEVAIVSAQSVSHLTSGAETSGCHTSSPVIMPQENFIMPESNFYPSPQITPESLDSPLSTDQRQRSLGLKCPMPACPDRSPMEYDMLNHHLEKVHEKGSAAERRAIIYESSFSERHLRRPRRHSKRSTGLKCPMPECRDRRPLRDDNLSPHLLNTHKIASSIERRTIVNQCKLEKSRNVDSNPK